MDKFKLSQHTGVSTFAKPHKPAHMLCDSDSYQNLTSEQNNLYTPIPNNYFN